jgi:WD40 repeat protein
MSVTKLKTIATVALVLALILAGGGWLIYAAWQADERKQPVLDSQEGPQPEPKKFEKLTELAGKEPRTDAYGDPLPQGVLARLGTFRFRHGVGVSFVAFTADGKTIVYAGGGGVDNVIRLVEARTGKELRSFELKPSEPLWQPIGPPLGRPTLSPDGKMLAIAWSDGSTWDEPEKIQGAFFVWDTGTGKELRRINCSGIPGRPAFSPDGKILVTVEKGRLHIWDAATGKKLHDFNDFAGQVGQPIFSADGKLLALDSFLDSRPEPRSMFFVDTTTWRQARPAVTLKDASFAYLHAFSPDGKLLVGDDATGHLYFWDAATGQLIERVLADSQATPSAITSVSFSPDGKMLAVVVRDGQVTLWDVATRKLLHKVEGAQGAAVFSPVGQPLLATGSNGPALRFWDPVTAKEIPINDAPSTPVQMTFWLPGGKLLAVSPAEMGYRLWDWRSGKQLAKVSTGDKYISNAVASPDGKLLAISHWRGFQGDDEAIHLFDLQAGKEIHHFGPKEVIGGSPISFTPDGRFLIAGELVKGSVEHFVRNRVAIWDTATGKVTRRLELKKEPKGGVNRTAVSADGKSLVLEMAVSVPPPPEITVDRGFYLNQEYYWCSVDLATGKPHWRTDRVKQTDSLAISSDGKVVACGMPGKVQLRNSDTGALLHELDCHTKSHRPWSYGQLLAFTSDGKRFIATDAATNVFVWDVATGKELHKYAGHRGRVLSVSTSPDNTMFATASEDSTVMLWGLDTQLKDRPQESK